MWRNRKKAVKVRWQGEECKRRRIRGRKRRNGHVEEMFRGRQTQI